MANHYIRTNAKGLVIHAFSSDFEQPLQNDILYAENAGRHFNLDLFLEPGIYKWKLSNGKLSEDNGLSQATEIAGIRLSQFKAQRDQLLKDCDWTQVSDCPIPNKAAWATYRQVLRDMPAQANFDPANPAWPTKPV